MPTSLQIPLRASSAALSLPDTGSAKRCSVSVPFLYTGPKPSSVLDFAAKSSGQAVQLSLEYPDAPKAYTVVVKLTKATLELPKKKDGGPRVRLSILLVREDTGDARDLLGYLLDAAHAQALELEAKLQLVQPPLDFDGTTPEREAG